MSRLNRRDFLKTGAAAMAGLALAPRFSFGQAVAAASPAPRGAKVLVTIFMRGAADGLNIIVPYAEEAYARLRPTIAMARPGTGNAAALDLDGAFGLHPALGPLLPLYKGGMLAAVQAVGSPDPSRSHFDAQDYMETAVPGNRTVRDGWLNRYLQVHPDAEAGPLRAVAPGTTLPLRLQGKASAVALGNIGQFNLQAGGREDEFRSVYEALYGESANALLSGTAREMFKAIDLLKAANPRQYKPAEGLPYSGPFGQSLQQTAQLIKAGLGLRTAAIDVGGWDTHINEKAQLANLLGPFGANLAAFAADLANRFEDVVVLTMSEFGRTLRENGDGGTDHGHGSFMLVLGGAVKGGRVYGDWPGLGPDRLYENRDLAVTTDFRGVFSEVLAWHAGAAPGPSLFPGFAPDAARSLNIFLA
jgi:uncharacterized protein (DUF1501 family)